MAHQLPLHVDLRPNALQYHPAPGRRRRTGTRITRPRLQEHGRFSVSREPSTQSTDFKVSFAREGNGMPSSSAAAPGNSSLLRRSKRQEVQARDGFMKIAEWVSMKVKDPMVEIDPVTVEEKIRVEEEMDREEQEAKEEQVIEQEECNDPTDSVEYTIATVAPATSLQPHPSEFSRVNISTKAAGVALILAAVALAYLGFRSKSVLSSKPKKNSESFSTPPGRAAGIGGKRDPGSSRVIHHSPSTKESSPPQDLHDQFRSSRDGDSSDKAVAFRASAELKSWQSQTIGTPRPAVPSNARETAFPSSPSAAAHGAKKEEKENAVSDEDLPFSTSSSDRDLPLAKPLDETLAVSGAGHECNPAGPAESEKGAKPFNEIVAVNGVGHDDNPLQVAESEKGAKPFEVVAVNGLGHDNNLGRVAESEKKAKPFEEIVVASSVGHDSGPAKVAGPEKDAVEFQNAMSFEPQAAKELWPKDDIGPTFEEEHKLVTSVPDYAPDPEAEVSDVKLPGVDFENAMLPEPLVGISPSELKPEITMESFSLQLVEDLDFNLGADFPAQPDKEDGPVKETLNGAAAMTSDAQSEEEKRKSYAEAIQAVVPAIAVGAGALSTLSGVSSGLEMVGLVATASFLAREMVMASSRQQLFGDFSKVKDHKSFLEFLQRRQIIKNQREE